MSVAGVLGHLDPLDSGTYIEDKGLPAGCSTDAEVDCHKSTWDGSAWSGDLTELDVSKAYVLNAASAGTLAYTGDDVHDETPINLTVSWNYIAYLPRFPAPVLTALASVVPSACAEVKDGASNVYWHEFAFDTIGLMQPGEGYEVECQQARLSCIRLSTRRRLRRHRRCRRHRAASRLHRHRCSRRRRCCRRLHHRRRRLPRRRARPAPTAACVSCSSIRIRVPGGADVERRARLPSCDSVDVGELCEYGCGTDIMANNCFDGDNGAKNHDVYRRVADRPPSPPSVPPDAAVAAVVATNAAAATRVTAITPDTVPCGVFDGRRCFDERGRLRVQRRLLQRRRDLPAVPPRRGVRRIASRRRTSRQRSTGRSRRRRPRPTPRDRRLTATSTSTSSSRRPIQS